MILTNIDLSEKIKVETILMMVCDYCEGDFTRQYSNHIIIIEKENHIIDKDACINCRQKKAQEVRDIKQAQGLLTSEDFGYWQYKENLLKEMLSYIELRGNLRAMQRDEEFNGKTLWSNIKGNGYHPYYLAKELGYQLAELTNNRPIGYYNKIENVIEEIDYLIKKLKRFPQPVELSRIAINGNIIKRLGGMGSIKQLFDSEIYLLDDSGFINGSTYEYAVAQFLLQNKITYKREVHPFPKSEGRFRSDFTIYFKGEAFYVEVWGYPLNANNERSVTYNISKEKKLFLYEKYNLNLIEIESDVFDNTYKNIVIELNKKFHYLLSNKDKINIVKLEESIRPDKMTESEIVSFLQNQLPIGTGYNLLPRAKHIQKEFNKLYREISKRYGTYTLFLKKVGKKSLRKPKLGWNKDRIFSLFNYSLTKYDRILNYAEMRSYKIKDKNLIGLDGGINTNGGLIELKLQFFIKEGIDISKYPAENNWVKLITTNSIKGSYDLDDRQIKMLNEILMENQL